MGFWWPEKSDGVRLPLNGNALVYLLEIGHMYERLRQKLYINKRESENLNKYDGFSRTTALAQSAWFAIDCIARFAQSLPVITLELTVLASLCLYSDLVFWKDKPSGIQITQILHLAASVKELHARALELGDTRASKPWYQTPLDFVCRED